MHVHVAAGWLELCAEYPFRFVQDRCQFVIATGCCVVKQAPEFGSASAELVAHAQSLAEQADLSKEVSFRRGNVNELPFGDSTFDWAWSVDCVGHPSVGEPLAALRELARVVRPGGQVAILGYSTQMLLPGHPRLEARLNATASAINLPAKGRKPHDGALMIGDIHGIHLVPQKLDMVGRLFQVCPLGGRHLRSNDKFPRPQGLFKS